MTINRNKRSVLLDLREEKAAKALRKLIKTCDVFAASVRYEGLKRLGLDYEAVKAIKPDIVYVPWRRLWRGRPLCRRAGL